MKNLKYFLTGTACLVCFCTLANADHNWRLPGKGKKFDFIQGNDNHLKVNPDGTTNHPGKSPSNTTPNYLYRTDGPSPEVCLTWCKTFEVQATLFYGAHNMIEDLICSYSTSEQTCDLMGVHADKLRNKGKLRTNDTTWVRGKSAYIGPNDLD